MTGMTIDLMQAQTWRILHIDDDEDDQLIVRSMLKEAKGQTVTLEWAASYEEGRRKLAENDYHAVLVDYDLGLQTGIELIRDFVNRGYSAPFILLTGRGSYEVDVEAMRAGATLYLTKNEINPLLLERSVRYAIERKQVEADLRERDWKLSVALDAAQLGAWTYNFTDNMIELDERAQHLYNASQPRVNHNDIVEAFLHPEDVQPMRDALRRAADPNGDGRYQMEYRILSPEGTYRWLSAWALAEFEGQGAARRAVRMTGATREITWEKKAGLALAETNDALRESERSVKELAGRFQAVLENSLDMAYRRNLRNDRYDYMSPVVEQVMGFTIDEMMEMSTQEVLERIHPDDRARLEEEMYQTAERGKAKLEYRFLCKDGKFRWFADYGTVTKDTAGNLLYRTGIVRDITEQMRTEQSLRASEERFQLASRAVAGVLYDLSLDRDEMYQSEGLERVVGYRPGDEPGGSKDWWPRNIHPEDYSRVQADLRAVIDSRKDSFAYEYRIRHKDGHWVYIWDQGYIVRDASGQAQRIVGICSDISDRVKAEQALRESERVRQDASDRFRDLANNISQLAWMADKTGQIFWYNQRWLEYTGTTLEEMERQGWKQFIHPDYISRVEEKITRCFASGENWQDTFPLRGKDGQYRWYLSQAKPIRDERGQVARWFGTNTDVTELHLLQEALRQNSTTLKDSEARYRGLADAMPQLVWTARSNGAVDYYNQRYRHYGGIAPSMGGNWNWGPVLHVDDLQPTIQAWEEAVRTATTYQIEHRVRMADGSYRWHLSRGIPAYDEDGHLARWYGTATDIHDFKQAQVLLRHREQRLRNLFEANLIGIVTRNRDGKFLEANDAYLEMIGYTREEIETGKYSARDITPPEYHYLEKLWIEEVLANGYCKPFEKEYIRKDGARIPVLVGYSLYEHDQEEFIGFVLNLSELKRAQAELAEYAEKLKRSNEALESFAFVASHDLQEPLRKINLFGSSLRRQMDGQLTEKAEDYLNRMQSATERMQAMINGLLELSRVNRRGSTFEQVDLKTLAEEVVSDLEASIHATDGQVIVKDLPAVEGDALQLRQMLQNLIGNGLKFHKEGVPPVVQISGERLRNEAAPMVKVVVEDNGIGFDEESSDQIFQPFVRLNGRSQYEGSGIGLAICQKIVERHEGSITAKSVPGMGSKFIILLPSKSPELFDTKD